MYLYIEQITFSLRKIIICLLIIFLSGCNSSPDNDQPTGNEVSANPDLLNDTLRLLCTEDQLHLASHLTNEFQKYHPTAATEISLCEPGNPEEILTQKKNDLFLVSDANFSNVNEDYWHIKYARDGVVGIINESNPNCQEILEFGLRKQQLIHILTGVESDDWQTSLENEDARLIRVFIGPDKFLSCKLLEDFLHIDQNDLTGIKTTSVQDMIDSVRMNPLSFGFCCQRHVYDLLTRKEIKGIKVVPIDCNANGILEGREKFYDNLDMLQRAMWMGKYPCHTFLNYYIVANDIPQNKLYIDFMKWILTEGQKELHTEGYILLRTRVINNEINELNKIMTSS